MKEQPPTLKSGFRVLSKKKTKNKQQAIFNIKGKMRKLLVFPESVNMKQFSKQNFLIHILLLDGGKLF